MRVLIPNKKLTNMPLIVNTNKLKDKELNKKMLRNLLMKIKMKLLNLFLHFIVLYFQKIKKIINS